MAASGEGPVKSKVLIISLSDFENRKNEIGQQLYDAAVNTGFFYIKDHGIPQAEIDTIFNDGEAFYGLPDDVKEEHVWIPDRYLGWRSQSNLESVTGNKLWEWASFGRFGTGGFNVRQQKVKIAEEETSAALNHAEKQIWTWSIILSFIFVFGWPLLALPAGVFSKGYFYFWVILSFVWGLVAAFLAFTLPIWESRFIGYGVLGSLLPCFPQLKVWANQDPKDITLSEDPNVLNHHIKLANTNKGLQGDQDLIVSPSNAADAKQAQFTVQ